MSTDKADHRAGSSGTVSGTVSGTDRERECSQRTGRELILATNEFAHDDALTSWRHLGLTVVLLLTTMYGTLSDLHLAGRFICSVLSALLLVRLFVIYHDFQHRAILLNSKLAEGVMSLCGMVCLAPPSIWRSSHFYHHRHNSKIRTAWIGSFPIMTCQAYADSTSGARRRYRMARHPIVMLIGYVPIFLIGMCLMPALRDSRQHADCWIALVLHFCLLLTTWLIAGWSGLLLGGLLPFFGASMVGSYLFYAQHNFPEVVLHGKENWSYELAALGSSSHLVMGRCMRWFTANIGYHHVHHLNSRIPFYRLPEAVRAIPELQSPRVTSLRPLEILRCLRLKLWDEDLGRMVPIERVDFPAAP